jgi:hypothetical protein
MSHDSLSAIIQVREIRSYAPSWVAVLVGPGFPALEYRLTSGPYKRDRVFVSPVAAAEAARRKWGRKTPVEIRPLG